MQLDEENERDEFGWKTVDDLLHGDNDDPKFGGGKASHSGDAVVIIIFFYFEVSTILSCRIRK